MGGTRGKDGVGRLVGRDGGASGYLGWIARWGLPEENEQLRSERFYDAWVRFTQLGDDLVTMDECQMMKARPTWVNA